MSHVVTATALNLRNEPRVQPGNRLALLDQGCIVLRLEDTGEGWWRVRTTLEGSDVVGYVAARYLAGNGAVPIPMSATALRVHLPADPPRAARDRGWAHAYPLNEIGQPLRGSNGPTQRASRMNRIIEWLDVENSARYRRSGSSTYCNIYAHDVCYLGGVYLPRVFWRASVLPRVLNGEPMPVHYGDTVAEVNANGLFDWLHEFGPRLGWRRGFSFTDAQVSANAGEVVLLVAQRVENNQPGHIAVIVPESVGAVARRDRHGEVLRPVISEAGTRNVQRATASSAWWTAARFRAWSLWLHR